LTTEYYYSASWQVLETRRNNDVIREAGVFQGMQFVAVDRGASYGVGLASKAYNVLRPAANFGANTAKVCNPRLLERLDAWHLYQMRGGTMQMSNWVRHTQGAPWGTGFKSGYGAWERGIASTHGNSLMSQQTTYLYRLETKSGEFLKWGYIAEHVYQVYCGIHEGQTYHSYRPRESKDDVGAGTSSGGSKSGTFK